MANDIDLYVGKRLRRRRRLLGLESGACHQEPWDAIAALHGSAFDECLLERVQGAARYIRDVEDRAQEQESHVQQLLRQVRAEIGRAHV